MAESELEKLIKKARLVGINVEVILDEIDRRIDLKQTALAKDIIDKVPALKPNITEIAKAVGDQIQTAQVDIDAVAGEVLKRIPTSSEAERQQALKDVSEKLVLFMKDYEEKAKNLVVAYVERALLEKKDEMVQGVRAEFQKRQDELNDKLADAGDGGKGGTLKTKWGEIPWDRVFDVIEKMSGKGQDPLEGLDRFVEIRNKVLSIEPQGPDVNQQFKSQSASFLEGIKLGAKATGSGVEPKKSSGPPGGPLNRPGKSTGLHPAVKDFLSR